MIAMAACREELLGQLQRLGCVEIREPETAGEDWSGLLERESSRLAEAKGALAEVNTALAAMRRYGQVKDGLFVKRRLVTEKEFLGGGLEAQAKTVTQDVGERLRTLSGIQTEMSRLQARRAGLLPWQDLDLPLEAEGTEHVLSRLGTCPAGTDVGALRLELEALPAELLEISADKQQRYLLLLCHRAAEEPVMEVLRAHGFSAAAFPGVTGTAAADLKQTDRQLEELQRRREEAEAAIAESARERDTLRTYADRLTAETARESAAERLLTDGTIVFFEGWAPAERMADVSALLERLGCAWEAADPAPEEYPEVPVKLKNNCLTRPLNMVTEMYSLPAYDNVDPNPLMAPFFILFYGVMMADMGYGLLMMLASVFVLRTYRPKGTMQHFFGLLGLCGFTDMRDVHKEIENGNKKAELALNMLVRSIKKTLGAYFFLLGGKVDALVFTAGIGENDDIVRAKVCEGLEELGVRLNLEENGTRKPGARTISTPDSKIKVLIIPTNEELQIAQATMEVLA